MKNGEEVVEEECMHGVMAAGGSWFTGSLLTGVGGV